MGVWWMRGGRNESGHGAIVLGELKQVWARPGQPELWLRSVAVRHNGCLCGAGFSGAETKHVERKLLHMKSIIVLVSLSHLFALIFLCFVSSVNAYFCSFVCIILLCAAFVGYF